MVSPVSPDPPIRDAVLGQQEAAHKQQDQEEEAAAGTCNDLIPRQSTNESEEGDAHAVHQEQQQDEGEEPEQTERGVRPGCQNNDIINAFQLMMS